MKKKIVRIIAIVLLIALALSLIPVAAMAAEIEKVTELPVTLEEIDMSIQNGKIVVNSIPRYYQNYFFYSYMPYGSGTLGSSGCSITCMAMAATYILDDYTLTPDRLAEEFGQYKGTNLDKMEAAAKAYNIPYTKTYKWREVVSALEEGKFAIVMVNEATEFTDGQHLMLITGIKDDKLFINDPNYRNRETMGSKYETGFEQWQVIEGFSGAWILEKEKSNTSPDGTSGKILKAKTN